MLREHLTFYCKGGVINAKKTNTCSSCGTVSFFSASVYAPVCTPLTADVSAASAQSEMFVYRPDEVQLQYTISNGEAVIHSILALSMTEEFVIPSELKGCPVTTIAEDCTVSMDNIKGLVIPESVERLLSAQFILYSGYDNNRWVRIENADVILPEGHLSLQQLHNSIRKVWLDCREILYAE